MWYDRVDLKTRKNIRRLIELKCAAAVKSAAKHVFNAIHTGKIIEQYPDSYPYPACLVLGVSTNNEYLHIVAGCNGNVVCIVTAYFPDSDKFESDSQTRKEK